MEEGLAAPVARGQQDATFGRHLPARALSQVAWSALSTVADHEPPDDPPDPAPVTTTTLLALGVPPERTAAVLARPT